jgi:hypothetical protein
MMQYSMKQLFISEMIMNACDVSPLGFAHRRAWLLIEVLAFWVNILGLVVILCFKIRLCGGGLELLELGLECRKRVLCPNSKEEVSVSISNDTKVMKE